MKWNALFKIIGLLMTERGTEWRTPNSRPRVLSRSSYWPWELHIRGHAAKSLQSCPTLCDPIDSRDSPGKNTGVGCHCLLQCMKVKSESEVAQLCPTLSNPMDCSLPGSSIHGIFQARVLEWAAIAFSVRGHAWRETWENASSSPPQGTKSYIPGP